LWTYALSDYFDRVEAFEPQPDCCKYLKQAKLDNVTIRSVALSSSKCEKILHIPAHMGLSIRGMATFSEVDGPCDSINVPVETLDYYDFREVSFIKIDVEGHETSVLEGARQTIFREKPTMVIEIEQRHQQRPINEIIGYVIKMGYEALFLSDGQLYPISQFDYENNQRGFLQKKTNKYSPLPKQYLNNFIFKPLKSCD
jgi:FkbM family methyltransferase